MAAPAHAVVDAAPDWIGVLLFVTGAGYMFVMLWIAARLRTKHVETWREMGEPRYLFARSAASTWNFGSYVLLSAEHHDAEDKWLSGLVYAARILAVLGLCSMALLVFTGTR